MTHIKNLSALKANHLPADDPDNGASCVGLPEGTMVNWLAVLSDPTICVKEILVANVPGKDGEPIT